MSTQVPVELAATDLLGPGVTFCPNPRMPLWSNHPKVFIDVGTRAPGDAPTAAPSTGSRPAKSCTLGTERPG